MKVKGVDTINRQGRTGINALMFDYAYFHFCRWRCLCLIKTRSK